jgi:glycosyltransferase involved in cell wall biosynthesis
MRVLHVIPSIAPRYGGPSTAIGPMCAALNRLPGVEVELAATDADGAATLVDPKAVPPGFITHLFPVTWSERWKFSAGLKRWLRRHTREFDLVHIHALWSFACQAAAAAARRSGVPYIVRPAGMLSAYTWSRGWGSKRLYWWLVERHTMARAAAFHATSTGEAQEIQTLRPGATTVIIPNGVDEAAWDVPADPHALKRRCGPQAGHRPILLFLSRLHPKKGISDLLLPALARLPRDTLLAIGGGPDPHEPGHLGQIRQQIDRLGLQDRVVLLGAVAAAERWQLFDGAAALVLPSHAENFGIVVAEAMARGCPVVVSDAVQAAEHVRAAGAGRIVPLDLATLAEALASVTADWPLRRHLGEAGRNYATQHFRWNAIAEQIHFMYRTCLRFTDSPAPTPDPLPS